MAKKGYDPKYEQQLQDQALQLPIFDEMQQRMQQQQAQPQQGQGGSPLPPSGQPQSGQQQTQQAPSSGLLGMFGGSNAGGQIPAAAMPAGQTNDGSYVAALAQLLGALGGRYGA